MFQILGHLAFVKKQITNNWIYVVSYISFVQANQ